MSAVVAFAVGLCSLCCLSASVNALLTIHPEFSQSVATIDGQPFFKPGQTLKLTCTSDDARAAVSWRRLNYKTANWSELIRGTSGSQFVLNPIKFDSGGNYSCTDGLQIKYFFLNVLHPDSIVPDNVVTNGTEYLTVLHCKQRFTKIFPLIWTRKVKNAEVILNDHPPEDRNFTVQDHDHGYALAMRSASRYPLKTGEYACIINATEFRNITLRRSVTYEASPDVEIVGVSESNNAVRNEPLAIICLHAGSDNPRVKWTFENATLGEDGRKESVVIVDFTDDLVPCREFNIDGRLCSPRVPRIAIYRDEELERNSIQTGQNQSSSVLYIHKARETDRGRYICTAKNHFGYNSASVFIRIKDKYAALYPFLGVVAEFILLFLIIGCCERRRKKRERREEEERLMNEASYETTGTATVKNRKE